MSLVAYDSSDEGSENEEKVPISTEKHRKYKLLSKITFILLCNKPHQFKDEEEENDNAEHNMKDLLNMLPKPRSSSSTKTIEENEDEILLKNKTENQVIKPTKKQTVKISVPSLSEVWIYIQDTHRNYKLFYQISSITLFMYQFKDVEDEEKEKKPARTIQPSQVSFKKFL